MSTEVIKQTYRDVEIVYIERDDKWNFIVNGRERNLESLAKAKESIDRALDKEVKEKPWEPFEAWYGGHYSGGGDYLKVRVTSEAQKGYGGVRELWITYTAKDYRGRDEQKREKVGIDRLFQMSPGNNALIQQVAEIDAEIEKLHKQAGKKRGRLTPIQVEVVEEHP